MHPLLTGTGVPDEIRAFFNIGELSLLYGSSPSAELVAQGIQFVPATDQVWVWNQVAASQVFITHSAMDAVAFLSCNRHRYPDLRIVAFVALGCLPAISQLAEIRDRFPVSKFSLVFANDLLGHLMDIYVAAALRDHDLRLILRGSEVEIICNGRILLFEVDRLTLNVFQKGFGIRTQCRTIKPKLHTDFLTQMLQQSAEP